MPETENGRPTGLAIDNEERLLVADTHYFRMMVFQLDGTPVPEAMIGGVSGFEPGQFAFVTDAVRDADGVRALEAELLDRFGPLPEPAGRLTALAALKVLLARWGIEELVVARGDRLRVQPVDLPESAQVRLQRLHPGAELRPASHLLTIPLPRPRPTDLIAWASATLVELLPPPRKHG
jgi:hypothetical protein